MKRKIEFCINEPYVKFIHSRYCSMSDDDFAALIKGIDNEPFSYRRNIKHINKLADDGVDFCIFDYSLKYKRSNLFHATEKEIVSMGSLLYPYIQMDKQCMSNIKNLIIWKAAYNWKEVFC